MIKKRTLLIISTIVSAVTITFIGDTIWYYWFSDRYPYDRSIERLDAICDTHLGFVETHEGSNPITIRINNKIEVSKQFFDQLREWSNTERPSGLKYEIVLNCPVDISELTKQEWDKSLIAISFGPFTGIDDSAAKPIANALKNAMVFVQGRLITPCPVPAKLGG